MLERPTDVGPHGRAKGMVAYEVRPVPGLIVGDEASDLRRKSTDLRMFMRLRDDISDAERDIEVHVPTEAQE